MANSTSSRGKFASSRDQPLPLDANGLTLEGVQKRIGARVLLEDVTLSVPHGELGAVAGPNAAGKSLILRILAGLVRPDEGRVSVGGVSVLDDRRAARAQIGYLPDDFGVYRRLTAEESVQFYAGVNGLRRRRRRVVADELLELVGLAGRRHDDVATLSRGERQRLGLAHALVHDPTVLLLDQPVTGLDAAGQQEMWELIGGLCELGKTVLVTGRQVAELPDSVGSVAVLAAGRIVAAGRRTEVAEQLDALDGSAGGTTL